MKLLFFVSSVLIISLIGSCKKAEKAYRQPAVQTQAGHEIIRDTVRNQQGMELVMAFDNSKRTAVLVWHGETIELRQDTVASGMRYSNATYELTEHQGTLTLRKGEDAVFSSKK